jgi:hypothetical protein
MRNELIEAASSDGSVLRVEFVWLGDRFGHRISAVNAHGELTLLLESIEGSGTDDWPPSPPLQSLHIEPLPNGRRAALLVGMAGRSHWSASIEAAQESAEILFDLACRHSASSKQLGSRYRAAPNAAQRLAILPVESRLARITKEDGNEVMIEPASLNLSSATARWKYRVQLLPAGTKY